MDESKLPRFLVYLDARKHTEGTMSVYSALVKAALKHASSTDSLRAYVELLPMHSRRLLRSAWAVWTSFNRVAFPGDYVAEMPKESLGTLTAVAEHLAIPCRAWLALAQRECRSQLRPLSLRALTYGYLTVYHNGPSLTTVTVDTTRHCFQLRDYNPQTMQALPAPNGVTLLEEMRHGFYGDETFDALAARAAAVFPVPGTSIPLPIAAFRNLLAEPK